MSVLAKLQPFLRADQGKCGPQTIVTKQCIILFEAIGSLFEIRQRAGTKMRGSKTR